MENTIDMLAKHYRRFPFPESPSFVTNINASHTTKDPPHIFMSGKSIIHASVKDQKIRVSSQFPSGQYVWDFETVHQGFYRTQTINSVSISAEKGASFNLAPSQQHDSEREFSSVIDLIVNGYENSFEEDLPFDSISFENGSFNELMSSIDSLFNDYIKLSSESSSIHSVCPKPSPHPHNMGAFTFCACGRAQMAKTEAIQLIENSETVVDHLTTIQTNSTRQGFKIGVVYVGPGDDDQNKIMKTTINDTSSHFREFITGLGWPVDLSTHFGYLGGLDIKTTKSSVYYSDFMYEVMFHIAPLLPTNPNDEQQVYKKRHIGNDHVHIIWCENTRDYNTNTITSQFNQAHIVIYPLQTALFRVDVHWRDDMDWFGPLRHSIIVNKKSLPSLVRETAVSAMVSIYQQQSKYSYPIGDNEISLQKFTNDFQTKNTTLYSAMRDLMVMD